jgi:pilus assembly protein CpaB
VRTVTLEVTPRIAEKVEVAQTVGTLSLVLRSIADNQSELERALASGAVSLPANASKEDEEKLLSQAVARPQEGASTFVTGGDVSRFQRSALPRTDAAANAAPAGPPPPSVRVTRGQATTQVDVGRGVGTLVVRTAQGVSNVGAVAPAALSTLR